MPSSSGPELECLIVGGGVIGLAVGRELARRGHEAVVIEAEARCGEHASSRNSGVIHAGIHYPPGSLKARCCVPGRDALARYCRERAIPWRRSGKLIVASGAPDLAALAQIRDQAAAAGVELQPLSPAQAADRAPGVACLAALWSPLTGLIDSAAYLLALQADLQDAGGQVLCHNRLEAADPLSGGGLSAQVNGQLLQCRWLINCAGASAQAVAASIRGLPASTIPAPRLSRGHYFSLQGPPPWDLPVYPVPDETGLGIHATPDLAGRIRFGPDAEPVDTVDYSLDPARRTLFAAAIRRFWPDLDAGRLQPDYAGIRAGLAADRDFLIQGPDSHGMGGLINLYGIDSPGLTASLALAARVADRISRESGAA